MPGALLTRTHLRQLRARAPCRRRSLPRALPVVALPGYSRPMVHVGESSLIERFSRRPGTTESARRRRHPERSWLAPGSRHARRSSGRKRYRVGYRLGGGRRRPATAGRSRRSARRRGARWVAGELAALRVPELELGRRAGDSPASARRRSDGGRRVDVAENTKLQHRSAVRCSCRCSAPPRRRDHAADVADLVRRSARRASARDDPKDAARARDDLRPRPHHAEPGPGQGHGPAATAQERPRSSRRPPSTCTPCTRLLPPRYRLPLLVLDATGMRLGELEALTWGDVDEPRRAGASRGRLEDETGAMGTVPPELFEAVVRRSCRATTASRSGASSRASAATGSAPRSLAPAPPPACPAFSPHDLRHRRISLLHLGGVPWARIGELVGHATLP